MILQSHLSHFKSLARLTCKSAKSSSFIDFSDKGAMWRNKFEASAFESDLDKLWEEVEPLYDELHKYVLNKLKLQYGDRLDVEDGLIPAHVLGL